MGGRLTLQQSSHNEEVLCPQLLQKFAICRFGKWQLTKFFIRDVLLPLGELGGAAFLIEHQGLGLLLAYAQQCHGVGMQGCSGNRSAMQYVWWALHWRDAAEQGVFKRKLLAPHEAAFPGDHVLP